MAFNCLKILTVSTVLSLVSVAFGAQPNGDEVEMFAAIEARQIDVKFIPKDATQATAIITNRTNRPLSIEMPKAFAGMPVLAQNNNLGGGNSGSSGSNQSSGGGFGGGGMGGGMGGGFFNIGPEKVSKIKVGTVCLEHGKKDPNPRVAYEIHPIDKFTSEPEVTEVLKMLADGKLDQSTAQAAAWHLTDGLTWNQLANKVKVKHLNGSVEMYFTPRQLQVALQAVSLARVQADRTRQASPAVSPGEIADAQQ